MLRLLLLGIAATTALGLLGVVAFRRAMRRLPCDYFVREEVLASGARRRWSTARNAVGLGVIAVGIALLVLPGQGLLTILAGVAILDGPLRRRVFVRLLARREIALLLAAGRREAGKPAFILPSDRVSQMPPP